MQIKIFAYKVVERFLAGAGERKGKESFRKKIFSYAKLFLTLSWIFAWGGWLVCPPPGIGAQYLETAVLRVDDITSPFLGCWRLEIKGKCRN